MHLLFVKFHLIVFEIVSTVLLCGIFIALFYYSVIFKLKSAMKDENASDIIYLNFSANFSPGVWADVKIELYSNSTNKFLPKNYQNCCILYSKENYQFKNKTKDEIVEIINGSNPTNIFLFENGDIASNFKHRLLNLKTECSSFNLTLFILISLFLIFLKITLLLDSIIRLKKIKSSKSNGKNEVYTNLLAQLHPEEYSIQALQNDKTNLYYNPVLSFLNPINVYYYILFHLTIVIIMPLIFPNLIEYKVNTYFGFLSNLPFSIYYSRSLFGLERLKNNKEVNLTNLMVLDNDGGEKLFLMHEPLNLSNYTPTNINPYMVNLLVMCSSIWLAQLFKPFNNNQAVKISDVDLKKGKLKKALKIISIVGVLLIWAAFIVYGLIYQMDSIYLYHRLLFNNVQRLADLKIPIYILVFYYHIFFYVIMCIYTYQVYSKNKKYEGDQKVEYNWFS